MKLENILNLFDGKKKTNKGWLVKCPIHADDTASLHISEDNDRLLVHCFAGCDTKVLLDFINGKDVSNFRKLSNDALRELLGQEKEIPKVEFDSSYKYTDEEGNLLYEILKYYQFHLDGRKKKTFKFRRPASTEEKIDFGIDWVYSLEGCRKVPYNLPTILSALENDKVLLVEGEKDANTVTKMGMIGTCVPFGGGKLKWRDEYNQYFINKDIVLIPDNDKAGYDFCMDIARSLRDDAADIKLLKLPVERHKEDITDYVEKYNGTLNSLIELIELAPSIMNYSKDEMVHAFTFIGVKEIEQVENHTSSEPVQVLDKIDQFEQFMDEMSYDITDNTLFEGLCEACYGTSFAIVKDTEGIDQILTVPTAEEFRLEKCPLCSPKSFNQAMSSTQPQEFDF